MKPIDMHVHIVGTGAGGTGCWLRLRYGRRLMAGLMLRHMGLPYRTLQSDLDRLYVARLLQLVQDSSFGAAVILAHEQVYDDRGRLLEDVGVFYTPNDYVLNLAKRHPEFLPAVAIHPARADALEELDRCLAEGAVMLKCLPCVQNIDCRIPQYTPFWERMAEAGLPLLAHTGGEHTLPMIRPDLTDPRILERPLQCGVTVIAAHCGTTSGIFDRDYFRTFVQMIRRHPRLYGDISALTVPVRGRTIPLCLQEPLCHRLVHGSDFPVPIFGHWCRLCGNIDQQTFRRWQSHPNPLERDYQFKCAMGFPPETFTRIRHLLRTHR